MHRAVALPRPEDLHGRPVGTLLLRCETEQGRKNLLRWAEAHLPRGEALVETRDLVGCRRGFRTVPVDPRAEPVAVAPPTLLRGGLTRLVTWWRVPVDALDAEEHHYEGGRLSHTYRVRLTPARVGKRVAPEGVSP